MDPGDHEKESLVNSYPDPSAQSAGVHQHPFYAEQQQQTRDGSLAHAPTAPMQGGSRDVKSYSPEYMRTQYLPPSTPQELAQQGLNVNQNTSEESQDQSKKKQKVSRACDECRRKKASSITRGDGTYTHSANRSNATLNLKSLVCDARHVLVQTRLANLVGNRKKEVQARGKASNRVSGCETC